MRPVQIITDSCADIDQSIRTRYGIDYARMKTICDGKEQWASLDFEYYTPKEFYDTMRAGNRILTAQVSPEEFDRIFRIYLEEGKDIVYIGCSSKQSGSVNTGAVVAKKLSDCFPEASIFCVDSLNATMGEGMLAVRAAEYRDKGLDAKAIAEHITADRKLVNEYCTVHNLDTFRRSGRVKASAAFFGNLFGVKPIIISDKDGYQTPIKKVKGRQASIREIVALLKDSVIDAENQCIYIAHADCAEEAEMLRQLVEREIPCREIHVGYIGPIVGASVGPDTLAVLGFGKEVTFKG